MGLALRDVNESLAGSLGIAEGTTEYMNMTSSVSDTVENFIGDGSVDAVSPSGDERARTDMVQLPSGGRC